MILVLLKQAWNVFFPLHHPYCQICGRRKEPYVITDEALRRRVTDGALSMLCFRHFDAMAKSKGIATVWRVSAEPDWSHDSSEV